MLLKFLFSMMALLSTSYAQVESFVPASADKSKDVVEGWHHQVSADFGGNLNDNDNVPGKKDGLNATATLGFKWNANLYSGSSELRNLLAISEAFNRSPSFDGTVQTADELKIDSLYLYNLQGLAWVSPYVNVVGTTNIFEGYDYQQEAKTYSGAGLSAPTSAKNKHQLLDSFGILNLQETVGGLFKIWSEPTATLEGRLGFGAKQIYADGQYKVISSDATSVLLGELQDTKMTGAEAGLDLSGKIIEQKIEYKLYAKSFVPLNYSPDRPDLDDKNDLDIASTELGARFGIKLVDWASLVYEWKHLREPLLVKGPQITQNVLLSTSYKFDNRPATK